MSEPIKQTRASEECFKPTFCIVTTVFNDIQGLMKTGSSILSQDYPLNWVIVDADSGSETRQYLESLKSDTHKIFWKSEKDQGLYHGMNKGFLMNDSQLYLFLNANDTLASTSTIRSVVDSFIIERWHWAVALAVRFDDEDTPVAVWEYLNPELGGLALGTRTFCHQATFYTRSILEKVMPYDQTNLAADHLLNIKAFSISHPKMIPHVTTFFANGGVSGRRPMSAAFNDLRRVRAELNLYFLKNRYVDYAITKFLILLLTIGGGVWNTNRKLSRKLVKDKRRVYPEKI